MAYYNSGIDDAFDDEAEDREVAQKEWHRAENDSRLTGYRLGLSAGQEETLQQGFDAGYREAAQAGFRIGRLQGGMSAGLSLLQSGSPGIPDQPICKGGETEVAGTDAYHPGDSTFVGDRESHQKQIMERCERILEALSYIRSELPAHLFDKLHGLWQKVQTERCMKGDNCVGELTELFGAVGLADSPHDTLQLHAVWIESVAILEELSEWLQEVNIKVS